jgi:isopropylmalate/homocitrate/citramalate synthase
MTSIRLTDTTLRDGSHAMSHRFTVDNVRQVVRALDDSGVKVIEVELQLWLLADSRTGARARCSG